MNPVPPPVFGAIFALVLGLAAAIGLRARASGSWWQMWGAALLLLGPCLLGGFLLATIGLLVATQVVAAAAGMRWRVSLGEWTALRLLGLLVWIVAVPVQLVISVRFSGFWPQLFLLPTLLWILAPLLPPAVIRAARRPADA